jgi:TolA-binding protein
MRWLPLPMLLLASAAGAADLGDLQQLLDRGQCQRCRLADADLVHAQLRGATLERADLSRANLNRANLQGANLRGANLRETMLQGADLSGADLRGALLDGCDLREADLTSARLDKAALSRSYWQGAKGVPAAASSYADLHNAGVEAALQGRHPQAEQRFSEAIGLRPNGAISWLARGIARTEQAKQQEAAQDFAQAARLYRQAGEIALADQLDRASRGLLEPSRSPGGNGLGSSLVGGAAGLLQQLAPYALKLVGRGLF